MHQAFLLILHVSMIDEQRCNRNDALGWARERPRAFWASSQHVNVIKVDKVISAVPEHTTSLVCRLLLCVPVVVMTAVVSGGLKRHLGVCDVSNFVDDNE